jgi:hypothetical protein
LVQPVDNIRLEKKWFGVSAAIGCLEGLSFALKGDPSFMLFWVIIATFIAMGLWFAYLNRRTGSGDGWIETGSIGFLLSVMIAELGFAAGVVVSLGLK